LYTGTEDLVCLNLDKVGINIGELLGKHRKGELSTDEAEMYHPLRHK
jgi:hypothetical protein